ncbi:MAG: peptidoglycan editing factor PgeF [Hydrogenophaga sp.]|nr:peptidoglycan editing factor PgeF [Hydrogenophaga sp.]
MALPAEWWVPDWALPAGVHAVFTTRAGGVSLAPFDSFNLGDHVRDDPDAVAANRARLRQALGAQPVFLNQVHGDKVARLDPSTPDGIEADACLTSQSGVACTVMVADCLPVLWCAGDGRLVGASHAGWRGLAGSGGHGVLEATCDALMRTSGSVERSDLSVWLGPCIGPRAFEVGEEVRAAFVGAWPQAEPLFQALPQPGNFLADLPGLARLRLEALGVGSVSGNDSSDVWCTFAQVSRFFSHRRDAARLGGTGRMAACIWKD